MPVPSYRVPVRVARGTYANLSANLAQLQEGEVVYANDQNALYVIEGGVLTKASADLSSASLGDLGNVDLTTTPPTDGQFIKWDDTNKKWVPASGGGGVTLLRSLTDVSINDGANASVYKFSTLPAYTGGRVILQPNGSSAYEFAGLSSWDNGNVSIVGGSSATARSTATFAADESIYFHPDPSTDGAVPTNHTIKIEVSGADGQRMLYRSAPTLGTGTGDLVVPTMGQVRSYADSVGGGASALNDLSDVSYTGGSLKPNALDEIVFSSTDVPATDTYKIFANATYGLGIGAYLTSGSTDASYVYVHPTQGIEFKSTAQIIRLTGLSGSTTNTPELRWETGNPTTTTPTGVHFGLKLPSGYSVSQTYTLPLVDGNSGDVLKTDGNGVLSFGPGGGGGASSINDLTDVDTSTTPPTNGQVLEWNGTKWVPATVSGGSGGGSLTSYVTDSGTAASGALTLTGMGRHGTLVTISTDLDAWVVFYPTAAARTADAARAYGTDPTPGSGVLAEVYVTSSTPILFTPGTSYFNNDTTKADAIYVAVRDQSGASVNATLTIGAYAGTEYTGISGGTFGSG